MPGLILNEAFARYLSMTNHATQKSGGKPAGMPISTLALIGNGRRKMTSSHYLCSKCLNKLGFQNQSLEVKVKTDDDHCVLCGGLWKLYKVDAKLFSLGDARYKKRKEAKRKQRNKEESHFLSLS